MPKKVVIIGKVVDKTSNYGIEGANGVLDYKINGNPVKVTTMSYGIFRVRLGSYNLP